MIQRNSEKKGKKKMRKPRGVKEVKEKRQKPEKHFVETVSNFLPYFTKLLQLL